MTPFDDIRFSDELVPFDAAIKQAWIDKCPPELLPKVEADYKAISDMHMSAVSWPGKDEPKLYIATAGSPCSGKSTELDLELESGADPRYDGVLKVDPDRYTMEYMNHTYRPLLSAGEKAKYGAEDAARRAYDLARPGSNIISNLLLNEGFQRRLHIAHGTTMTSPFVGGLLEKLGKAGYERRLLLCYGEDDMRVDAGQKRIEKEAHYQVDPSDFVEKGKLFPQRMTDYFVHADHLILMWKGDVEQRATRAAEYRDGQCIVKDQDAFDAFVNRYEAQRFELSHEGITIPSWSDVEDIYYSRSVKPGAPSSGPDSVPKPRP